MLEAASSPEKLVRSLYPRLNKKGVNAEIVRILERLQQDLNHSLAFSTPVLLALQQLARHPCEAVASLSHRVACEWIRKLSYTLNHSLESLESKRGREEDSRRATPPPRKRQRRLATRALEIISSPRRANCASSLSNPAEDKPKSIPVFRPRLASPQTVGSPPERLATGDAVKKQSASDRSSRRPDVLPRTISPPLDASVCRTARRRKLARSKEPSSALVSSLSDSAASIATSPGIAARAGVPNAEPFKSAQTDDCGLGASPAEGALAWMHPLKPQDVAPATQHQAIQQDVNRGIHAVPRFRPVTDASRPKLLQCLVHGSAVFCSLPLPMSWPPVLRKQNSVIAQARCSDCRNILDWFIVEAPLHCCFVEGVEVEPGEGPGRMRVRLRCVKGHKVVATASVLRAASWCPACVHQNELRVRFPPVKFEDLSAARAEQKRLFEIAQKTMMDSAASFATFSVKFPPCMRKSCLPSPRLPTLRFPEGEIAATARRDCEIYQGVSLENALLIWKILRETNPWRVLQVEPPSSWSQNQRLANTSEAYLEAKRSYKNLARRVHPDKNPHPKAGEVFSRVDHAWRAILARVGERPKPSS